MFVSYQLLAPASVFIVGRSYNLFKVGQRETILVAVQDAERRCRPYR